MLLAGGTHHLRKMPLQKRDTDRLGAVKKAVKSAGVEESKRRQGDALDG